MKPIIIILLTTFLANCRGPAIRPAVMADISFQFDRCRIRCYDLMQIKSVDNYKCNLWPKIIPDNYPVFYELSIYKSKKTGKKYRYLKFISGNYSLETCDKLSGFFIDDYAIRIKPDALKLKRYYDDI